MKKSFQELDVIDNFMFNELMMQEDKEKSKEFCRSILEPIIEKKIKNIEIEGQRVMQGVDPKARGIQMDAYVKVYQDELGNEVADVKIKENFVIYDLEPNNTKTSSDEKRSRLYHSLIDGHVFESGTIYSKLPDVFVIMIIPSQRLANMLKFMVESTEANARKAGLSNVNEMVESIKRNRRVGVKYMQSWEEMMYYEEKGRQEGHASGVIEGKISSILELLQEYDTVTEQLRGKLIEQKDEATINRWIKLAAKCGSLEEFINNM